MGYLIQYQKKIVLKDDNCNMQSLHYQFQKQSYGMFVLIQSNVLGWIYMCSRYIGVELRTEIASHVLRRFSRID